MTCKICEWIENKDNVREKDGVKVVYEDERTFAILSDDPKVLGHIMIFPKEHVKDISQVSEEMITHYFFVASFSATAVFEGLGAQGTNIIVNNGSNSERRFSHFCINVLPRKQEDGIEFKWEAKKDINLEEIQSRIKDKAFTIGKEKKEEEKKPEITKEKEEEKISSEEENYMIKQLKRIP